MRCQIHFHLFLETTVTSIAVIVKFIYVLNVIRLNCSLTFVVYLLVEETFSEEETSSCDDAVVVIFVSLEAVVGDNLSILLLLLLLEAGTSAAEGVFELEAHIGAGPLVRRSGLHPCTSSLFPPPYNLRTPSSKLLLASRSSRFACRRF